jgi:hypothetical protein
MHNISFLYCVATSLVFQPLLLVNMSGLGFFLIQQTYFNLVLLESAYKNSINKSILIIKLSKNKNKN